MPFTSSVGRVHCRSSVRVPGLAERRGRADLREIRRIVERQRGDLGAFGGREVAHRVVEAGNGDAAARLVQRRDETRHRVQRVRDRAAMAPGVQILRRGGERELEPGEPTTRDGERRLLDPPHRAVRGENDVGGEQRLVLAE